MLHYTIEIVRCMPSNIWVMARKSEYENSEVIGICFFSFEDVRCEKSNN